MPGVHLSWLCKVRTRGECGSAHLTSHVIRVLDLFMGQIYRDSLWDDTDSVCYRAESYLVTSFNRYHPSSPLPPPSTIILYSGIESLSRKARNLSLHCFRVHLTASALQQRPPPVLMSGRTRIKEIRSCHLGHRPSSTRDLHKS